MNSTEAPLTLRQGVIIASRALCVLLLVNAIVNISNFPGIIAGLLHAWRTMPDFAIGRQENYVLGIYIRDIAVATIRLAIELFFAWWFYGHGPAVAKFLLGNSDTEAEKSANKES